MRLTLHQWCLAGTVPPTREAIVMCCILLILSAFTPEVRGDLQKLQGTWRTVRRETGSRDELFGDEASQVVFRKMHWSFRGDRVFRHGREEGAGEVPDEAVTLEPGRRPKGITLTRDNEGGREVFPGIYELRGDTLTIGVGGPERPREFSGKPGARELWVLKRYDPSPCLRMVHRVVWYFQDRWDLAEWPFATLREWTDRMAR